jgi:hypothetical protein
MGASSYSAAAGKTRGAGYRTCANSARTARQSPSPASLAFGPKAIGVRRTRREVRGKADVVQSKGRRQFDRCGPNDRVEKAAEVTSAGRSQLDARAQEPDEVAIPHPLELNPHRHLRQAGLGGESASAEARYADVIGKLERDRFVHADLPDLKSHFSPPADHTPTGLEPDPRTLRTRPAACFRLYWDHGTRRQRSIPIGGRAAE